MTTGLRYEVAPGVKCRTCEAEAVSVKAHTAGFDYCEICYYTGRAYHDARREQLDRIEEKLGEGWGVAVEHTGGGCFWLALTPPSPNGGVFYIATDGEASLPDLDGEPILGGWGAVGRESEETVGTGEGVLVYDYAQEHGDNYWDEYPQHSLSDDQLVEVVLRDWKEQK